MMLTKSPMGIGVETSGCGRRAAVWMACGVVNDARQGEDHADDSQQGRAVLRGETAVEMAGQVTVGQVEENLHDAGQADHAESHNGQAGELADIASEAAARLYQQHALVIQYEPLGVNSIGDSR